jgi:hypothetical protein
MVAVFPASPLPVDGIAGSSPTIWDIHGVQALLTRLLMVFFNGGAAVSLFPDERLRARALSWVAIRGPCRNWPRPS